MNPIKIIRKLGAALRGGPTFAQVFLGVFAGFAIGMLPGVNLSFILLAALLLILNVNGGIAAVAIIIGKILCLILAPLTFNIGYILIHSSGLEDLIKTFSDTPVLALLDLHVYCMTGAIPVIIILGGAFAFFIAKFFAKFKEVTAKAGEKNKRYQKIMNNKVMKAVLWLAFGGKKEEGEEEKEKAKAIFLKGRITAGIAATVIVCIISFFYLDTIAKHAVIIGIESMNGAEVNVDSASLSLTSGRFEINGLQVTDPQNPADNSAQAQQIITDIDIKALLTRRFTADEITCSEFKSGAKRSSPGEVYIETEKKEPEPVPENMNTVQRVKMYYDKVKDIREKIKKLNEFLDSNDPQAEEEKAKTQKLTHKEKLQREAELKGYLNLSAQDVLSKHPAWLIRKITIDKLSVSDQLPTMILEGKNICSAPSLIKEKRSIKVRPDEEAVAEMKKKLGGDILDKAKKGISSKVKGLFGK